MTFNENLAELFTTALSLHKGFVYILLALVILHFCLIHFGVNSPNYAKRIRLFLPTYYMFLAALLMTGLLMMSAYYFAMTLKSAVMLVVLALLIGLGAMEFKKLKIAMKSRNFIEFRKKTRLKVLLDLVLIIIASGVR